MIDSNGDVSVSAQDIAIKRKTEIVVLEGWAADFVNGVPLTTIVVKLNSKMYYVDYGYENLNLAKRFKNDLFSNIAFRVEIPYDELRKADKISFHLFSYQGEKFIRYPELEYTISVAPLSA